MIDINSLRSTDDTIIADSVKVINKILHFSDLTPLQIYLRSDLTQQVDISRFQEVKLLSKEEMDSIKGEKFHKGAIASFEKPILEKAPSIEAPFVVLNGVTSPENIGSIVRTVAGLGFKSFIFDNKSCSPLIRRAIRVSMGNFIFLKIHQVQCLKDFIKNCRYQIFATANESEATNLYHWDPPLNCGLLIGSEGHGIDRELIPLCQGILKIPTETNIQHFNAAQACAITASWIHSKKY